jgi:large subunit ribosomal protein L13
MKTTAHKYTQAQTNIDPRNWWIVDLDGKTLGRAATVIAMTLRGKNKPIYTPHADAGDFVVVINAAKVKLTGKKWDDKIYNFFSGYVGGMRYVPAKQVLQKKPEHLIKQAVAGMLPKSFHGKRLMTKLKVYAGAEHPHAAQQPQSITLNTN